MSTLPLLPSPVLAPSGTLAPDRVQTIQRVMMIVALYVIPAVVCLRPGIDWDLWWHLRVGEWVVHNRAVTETDPFSIHGAEKPWVAYSWLFEVLVYGLHQAFGLAGAMIYQTALALAVVAAVHRLIARREPRFLVAVALTGAAILALAAVFKQRPWMFTILFSTLTLDVVLDLRSGRKNRLTWFLPLLYVLWANIHIQFIYGLFILGLACVAPMIDRAFSRERSETTATKPLWLLTAACTLATLVNPYHLRLYLVVLEYATQPGPFQFVNELRPPDFHDLSEWVMLGFGVGASFALIRQRKVSAFDVLFLAAAAVFAFRARRDLWFLVLASLAVLTRTRREDADRPPEFGFTWARCGFVVTAIAAVIPLVWQARHLSKGRLDSAVAQVFPEKAVDVVRERGYPGPLFNDFDWGGYLIWALPQYPVVVDGRTNLHGDERLIRLGATWAGATGWQNDPDLAAARLIIANAATPLAALLETDPRFERVHADDLAKVFVRHLK